jgi:flagellar basal body-associated protein FliL
MENSENGQGFENQAPKKKKGSKFWKAALIVLILAILGFAIAFIVKYSMNGTGNFKVSVTQIASAVPSSAPSAASA